MYVCARSGESNKCESRRMLARAVVLAAVLAVQSEPHGRILGKHQGENESDSMPCSRSRTIYGEHTVPNAITTNVIAGAPGHPRWRGEEVRQPCWKIDTVD